MISEVNQVFKTDPAKFKGEEKERYTIRRNKNLGCVSRQRLGTLVAGNNRRATLGLKTKDSLEMCPPWISLVSFRGPWATRKHPKRSKNKQVMLNTHLRPCFNVFICVSFALSLLLEGPHVVHGNDKNKHSHTLEKEHSQGPCQMNFTSCPTYLVFCKAVGICCWLTCQGNLLQLEESPPNYISFYSQP